VSTPKPYFELVRIIQVPGEDAPRIVPVKAPPWEAGLERRGVLGLALAMSSAAFARFGANSAEAAAVQTQPTAEYVNAHRYEVRFLATTPDGATLVSGGGDGYLKLWSLSTLSPITRLNNGNVTGMCLSPDGRETLYIADSVIGIRRYSVTERRSLTNIGTFSACQGLAMARDSSVIATAVYSTIHVNPYPSGTQRSISANQDFSAVTITPDSKTIIAGGDNRTIGMWNIEDRQLIRYLYGHKDVVQALSISPDGALLASGSRDNTINLWSLPNGRLLRTLVGHTRGPRLLALDGVTAVTFTPDGRNVISAGADETVRLWNAQDGKPAGTLTGHRGAVRSLSMGSDWTLASGDELGAIILWDLTRLQVRTFLFDPESNLSGGQTYQTTVEGRTVTYTLPCGSPIPAGATCTCNCVAGTYRVPTYTPPSSGGGGGGGGGGTICTCIPIRIPF
jgi:WD40 repeat protein